MGFFVDSFQRIFCYEKIELNINAMILYEYVCLYYVYNM